MEKYRISEDLLLQTVKDESVILDPGSGVYFTLNPVGTRMLQLYRTSGDAETVVKQIVVEYEVDIDLVRRDLRNLLEELSANGLADRTDPKAS